MSCATHFRRVDFLQMRNAFNQGLYPQPDGPLTATTSPRSRLNDKSFDQPSISNTGMKGSDG